MDRWLVTKSKSTKDGKLDPMPSCSNEPGAVKVKPVKCFKKTNSDSLHPDPISDSHPSTSKSDLISPTPAKKKNLTVRVFKFKDSWTNEPEFRGWLHKSNKNRGIHDLGHCNVCDIEITAHKSEILRHSKSERHQNKIKDVITTKDITKLLPSSSTSNKDVKIAELKLAGLIACENLPFTLMDTLVPLLKEIAPDSKILANLNTKRTKTTHLVKNSLGSTFLELLYEKLRQPNCFFSIIMDETTDQSSTKQCALTVIYQDPVTETIKTSFFDMFETLLNNAEGLFNSLINCIVSKNIPLQNLIGFSSDTTNVMVGDYHSVFSHLKSEIDYIVCVKCSCHMAHLAASKACLQLPKSVEDLLRNLSSHFSRSFSRQQALKEMQQFFCVEIHKILSPANTRWLSLKACVDRVLEQYTVLEAYLRTVVFDDPSQTTEQMLSTLKNKFTLIYLEFMSYTLGILTEFNCLFQSETPLLHKLKPEMEKLLRDFCSNYMDISYIRTTATFSIQHKNPTYFMPIEKMYLGVAAQETLDSLKKDTGLPKKELDQFLVTCLNFYVEVVDQLKTRFDFSDPIFELLELVEPKNAQSFSIRNVSQLIVKRFPFMKDIINMQDLDTEWKRHALLDHVKEGLDPNKSSEEYWKIVFSLRTVSGSCIFPNLKIVINLLLILPFSNASVERVFSTLKNIKTDHRNKLKTDTVKALIATREGISENGGCVAFRPTKSMLQCNIWN